MRERVTGATEEEREMRLMGMEEMKRVRGRGRLKAGGWK
jgi:hypothetical protein